MSTDIYVYVAGPMTQGDTLENIRKAVIVGNELLELGLIPYVPHSMIAWPLQFGHDWDTWLGFDEKWIKKCDCLLRLKGDSPGADREVEFCHAYDIPVFYDINVMLGWAKENGWAKQAALGV